MGSISLESSDWQQRSLKKRQQCLDLIPHDWRIPASLTSSLDLPLEENANDLIRSDVMRRSGILTGRELSITEEYTLASLISALAAGSLTSLEVTVAYSKRAAIAQQLVSCLTETMFTEAQERAKYLDDLRSKGQLAGPLHGVPISIKDSFHVKGTEATIGIVSFLGEKSTENSPLVDLLLDLGAVIYVKTSCPQTMMTTDSHNNIFHRTLNPWNTLLGPGGSSGGEGALVALRGSPLGVGTDIGGSIRIPALCCGTYGFKPSASRVPNGRVRICSTSGMRFILASAGPLAMDMEALGTFTRLVFDARPARYDSTVFPIPWKQATIQPSLKIGVVPEDPAFPLHPPIKRVLADAIRCLEAHGHQIIYLTPEECQIMALNEVASNLFNLDRGAIKHLEASGEPFVPAVMNIMQQIEYLRKFHKSSLPDTTKLDRLDKSAVLNTRRAELRDSWRKLWARHDLDTCLAPPAQSTAVLHDKFGVSPYTTFLNCLDYPSCVIPFGEVGESDSAAAFRLNAGQSAPRYDFDKLKGAPCGVQFFTPTMCDEECLDISKEIDKCLKSSK